MGMGQSSCLLKEVKECVEKAGIPLETAISTITANPAEILSLKGKGRSGKDMMRIFAYWIRDWRFRKSLHGGRRCIGNSILVILGKGHSFAELRPFF